MKQETLREAAARHYGGDEEGNYLQKIAFHEGAKWQEKKMYSEEDMKKAFKVGFTIGYGSDTYATEEKDKTCEEWFERIKK